LLMGSDKAIFTTNVAVVVGTGGVAIGAGVVVADGTHCPGAGVQSLHVVSPSLHGCVCASEWLVHGEHRESERKPLSKGAH
jgi:hypothetical protein